VKLASLEEGRLEIELLLHGVPGAELQLCADIPGGGKGVRGLATFDGEREGARLAQDGDDEDCWDVPAPAPGEAAAARFRYRYELRTSFGWHGDPDRVARAGEGFVFNDEAVLLGPSPLPEEGSFTVTFELPEGVSVSPPWPKLEGAPWRYASTARQYAAGSYVALGRLEELEPIAAEGGVFTVSLVDLPRKAPAAVLHAWLAKAARQVAQFYRQVPEGRVHVILVPVPGADEPTVFGTALRRAAPSVVLFLGADADPASFDGDWMATHELFHVGNPRIKGRIRWFNEGSATYYQEVLRARAGGGSEAALWGTLQDKFSRFCDGRGDSLREASAGLGKSHAYLQVYWSGACLFFRADVAIRVHSRGKRSLDDVLRDLLRRGNEQGPFSEAEAVAAIDRECGAPVASSHLDAKGRVPLRPLLEELGIEPTGPETVRLHDDARLAWVRRAIAAPARSQDAAPPRAPSRP
jgi:hypothetical protein